jgi:hypothetical protein
VKIEPTRFSDALEIRHKRQESSRCRWLMPVVLATRQAEIRRIGVKSSPGKKFERSYLNGKKGEYSGKHLSLQLLRDT